MEHTSKYHQDQKEIEAGFFCRADIGNTGHCCIAAADRALTIDSLNQRWWLSRFNVLISDMT